MKKGFTLAEVLITLSIIGIIASMTVPALQKNMNDAQLKVAFKKSFANLSTVTKQVIQENGGTAKGLCTTDIHNCFREKFLKYMSPTKRCSGNWGCFPQANVDWFHAHGGSTAVSPHSSAILNDGSAILFYYADSACSDTKYACGRIYVDVNGFKKPNITGKDIFQLAVRENSLFPAMNSCASPHNVAGLCAGIGVLTE